MTIEEAIRDIEECVMPYVGGISLQMAVEALKEQKPHGEWIPCSERLPEDDEEVIVWVRRKDGEKSEMNGFHIARKHRMKGDPEGNNNFWGIPVAPCEWRIEGWSYFFEPEVLAWIPLPEPYKLLPELRCGYEKDR